MPEPAREPAEHTAETPAPSDAELVARVRSGDRLGFELIMRRHNRRLFRLARSLIKDTAEAEDVLQEAYVRAYARLGELVDQQALVGWLARIVTNEALGRLRTAARVVSLEDHRLRGRADEEEDRPLHDPASDQPDPERLAASGELRRLLEAAVDALPDEFRAVFVLREVEGLSTAETAACLAIRPETVRTRLHRARRLLQEALGRQLAPLTSSLFEFDGGRCDRLVACVLARVAQDPDPGPVTPAAPSSPAGSPAPALVRRRWLDRLLTYLQRRTR
jgi:RNA polymerase sigma-70 factor (ECF subfamily)